MNYILQLFLNKFTILDIEEYTKNDSNLSNISVLYQYKSYSSYFLKKKSTIYYIGYGGSLCLLGARYEPITLTIGKQDITNMTLPLYYPTPLITPTKYLK